MNRSGVLILAGHAIYENGLWYGIRNEGDAQVYENHIHEAFTIADKEGYTALSLSGGHSRNRFESVKIGGVSNSEAKGMSDYALHNGLYLQSSRLILEAWARDSFENVFFSVLAFYRCFNKWPERIGIVSWSYKNKRFETIVKEGLGFKDFKFYGSGNLRFEDAKAAIGAEKRNNDRKDPLQRTIDFLDKRIQRTPNGDNEAYISAVKAIYDVGLDKKIEKTKASTVSALVDRVESLNEAEGTNGESKTVSNYVKWPWIT